MLERAGIPTVVVCSDEFGPLARAESQVLGLPGLPLVAIPHPLAGNDSGLVKAKANAIVQEIVAALSDPVEAVDERYRSRFLGLSERRLDGGALCIDDTCAIDPTLSRSAG